ncbi:DUF6438 domain-containing protein [Asticcacaulis sp. AC402]|uniref:DUF6438 domain-containing protein n=1 Tax=Asticcacaulis sp. AC402 TaxID=1282361 RepID=UPI0003C4017B|nr:DUF6438 domain-containing protein [Asticcacaulis sp. AC402]ESQ75458.1 hypothetical protein ABAC402_10180 [Asticcacaulis sp. AC402]
MLKAKATALKRYAIIGAVAVGAGLLFGLAASAWQVWREDSVYRDSHISYVQFPCETMTTAGACPAFRVDAFGDGTVVYQGGTGTKIPGNYTYRVSGQEMRAYIRDLHASSFWSEAVPAGPNSYGGSCIIILHVKDDVRRNGCLKWRPGSDQAMNDPGVSVNVAQLEALTRVNSLTRGDTGTTEMKRHARPYTSRRDLF